MSRVPSTIDGRRAAPAASPPLGAGRDGGARLKTHAQAAREWIRDSIVNGVLEEGQVLSQVQLSREIGVSRTPLREAIRMLEAEGWLQSEPNRSVRVAQVSLTELEQFYAMRVVLESMAITVSVPRLTNDDLATAQEMLEDGEALLRDGAYDEWERLNRDFHSVLIAPAGESVLQSCHGIIDACWRYRKVYVLAQPTAFVHAETDHRVVLDACEARDPIGAAAALARHLARTAITLIAAVDPGYDPVAVRTAMLMVTGRYGDDAAR